MISDHACERYAERVLHQTLPSSPEKRDARIKAIKDQLGKMIGDRIKPTHKHQYHLPIGKVVFVVKDGTVVTVKT